jgi:3-hydroxyisobutyrate dehydrogenase-like beta-hydroxyacid dehydrogenase
MPESSTVSQRDRGTGPIVEQAILEQQSAAVMRAGFIGLGSQGAPIARRIAAAGIPTTVWARRPAAAAPLAEIGASVAANPAELGADCDIVGICVFDAAGAEEVLFGERGVVAGMAPGGIVTVHSTVSPTQVRQIAARAAGHGITVLDAPVSGGAAAADAGELLVLLAGPEPECERAVPVIKTYAGQIVRLGPVGAAQTAKLINNALFAGQVALVLEAQRIGAVQGIEPATLVNVLRHGSARSFAVEAAARAGSAAALANGAFAAAIGKDIGLLAGMVEPGDGESPLLGLVQDLLNKVRESTA